MSTTTYAALAATSVTDLGSVVDAWVVAAIGVFIILLGVAIGLRYLKGHTLGKRGSLFS